MTSHAPPVGLTAGARLATLIGGRWREGTCIEMNESLFRVRYNEPLPSGAWTALHGKMHDKVPVATKLLGEAQSGAAGSAAASELSVELRGGGVVLMASALSTEEQVAVLQDCLRTMPLQRANASKLGDKPPPDTVWSYGYEPGGKRPACLDVAAQILQRLGSSDRNRHALHQADARESNAGLHLAVLLCNLSFERVWARLYAGPHALGWHHDPDEGIQGWVINVNLGADATFAWRHAGATHRAKLASGDALLFQGHILEHAIEQIDESSCPPFWREAMSRSNFARVGLQMRA